MESYDKETFLRLLQHEIDHVNGLLCSRLYTEGGFYGDRDAMLKVREEENALKKTSQAV